ncbi:MAG: guanitoxin biosynthesis heme-dependent pre-guanitoxin N-hydroxylase GntA [Cyclobacteriaceae bacterium]
MQRYNNQLSLADPTLISSLSNDSKTTEITNFLLNKITHANFPCIGAKQAITAGDYQLGIYDDLGTVESAEKLAKDLTEYIDVVKKSGSSFMTMIAVFNQERLSESIFETLLWRQLYFLKRYDPDRSKSVAGISDDPNDENYCYTFNNEGFYVVGMHANASRDARMFPYPAMAFNLHSQFEELREGGNYDRMKEIIRKRDKQLQGSINPMLSDFGNGLEAPQYSGRQVDETWRCPFNI